MASQSIDFQAPSQLIQRVDVGAGLPGGSGSPNNAPAPHGEAGRNLMSQLARAS